MEGPKRQSRLFSAICRRCFFYCFLSERISFVVFVYEILYRFLRLEEKYLFSKSFYLWKIVDGIGAVFFVSFTVFR